MSSESSAPEGANPAAANPAAAVTSAPTTLSDTFSSSHFGVPVQRPEHAETASVELPADKELVLKVIPLPGDCNANGDIFGGWVMAQVDLAGSVLPARYVDGRMATVAVNQFIFKQPVRVGDILSFFGSVTRLGNTSITVQIEVYAERFSRQGRYIKVTEASLTYVAIDNFGKPRKIPNPQGLKPHPNPDAV